MIGLPPALTDWSESLEIFPRESVLSIVPWLPRLAASIGRLASRREPGHATPDGYAGITRRGRYERLLLSEWLLAEEMPDEFVRRASMGEHGFYEIARVAPAGSTRCVVLFDGGPHQLGAPRIAHLATLIVLARRAEEAGAELSWGVLQDPRPFPLGRVDEQTVLTLLGGRSAREATADDVDIWLTATRTPDDRAPDDLWFVGGARTARHAEKHGASYVAVEEPIGSTALHVRISHGARDPAEVTLELPEQQAATRLLRNPFEVVRKRVPRPGFEAPHPTAPISLSADGNRVFARTPTGARVYAVPHSSSDQLARPRHLSPPHGTIVAAAAHRRRYYTVSDDDDGRIWLTTFGKSGAVISAEPLAASESFVVWAPGRDTPIAPLFARGRGRPPACFYFVGQFGHLWRINTKTKFVERVAGGVANIAAERGRLFAVVDDERGTTRTLELHHELSRVTRAYFRPRRPTRAFVVDAFGSTVFEDTPGRWAASSGRRDLPAPPEDWTVLGFIRFDTSIARSPDGRTIAAFTKDESTTLFERSEPLRDVLIGRGRVLIRTQPDRIRVIDISRRAVIGVVPLGQHR